MANYTEQVGTMGRRLRGLERIVEELQAENKKIKARNKILRKAVTTITAADFKQRLVFLFTGSLSTKKKGEGR